MFLLDWYREYLDIKRENERQKIETHKEEICESCEYLKLQLEKQQQSYSELVDKLMTPPQIAVPQEPQKVDLKPKFVPWRVRRNMLEAEDRQAATVLKAKQKEVLDTLKVNVGPQGVVQSDAQIAPDDDPDVIALEQAMDEAAKEREAQKG